MKDDSYTYSAKTRQLIGYFVFSAILCSLTYRYFAHALPHQLENPVFQHPYVDLTYWAMLLSGLPKFIVSHDLVAIFFDVGLLASTIAALLLKNKRFWALTFSAFYFVFFIISNNFGLHHTHCITAPIFIAIPFWFKDKRNFALAWEGIRYYTLFIYSSAFFWKLFRGSLFDRDQAQILFMNENVGYMSMHPESPLTHLIQSLIQNPGIAHALLLVAAFLQAAFIIGFFTKKFDIWFFVLPFAFHLSTFLFMEVMFFEILVLNVVFLPWKRIAERIPPFSPDSNIS